MKSSSHLRRINGALSLGLVLFLFVHELLGALWGIELIPATFAWLVWVGIGGVLAHVGLSGATTVEMFGDPSRPPSERKRAHHWKKWITGGIVAALMLIHMALQGAGLGYGAGEAAGIADSNAAGSFGAGTVIVGLLALALGYHICVGMKSLRKDLGAPRSFRALGIGVTVVFTALVLAIVLCASFAVL